MDYTRVILRNKAPSNQTHANIHRPVWMGSQRGRGLHNFLPFDQPIADMNGPLGAGEAGLAPASLFEPR